MLSFTSRHDNSKSLSAAGFQTLRKVCKAVGEFPEQRCFSYEIELSKSHGNAGLEGNFIVCGSTWEIVKD